MVDLFKIMNPSNCLKLLFRLIKKFPGFLLYRTLVNVFKHSQHSTNSKRNPQAIKVFFLTSYSSEMIDILKTIYALSFKYDKMLNKNS